MTFELTHTNDWTPKKVKEIFDGEEFELLGFEVIDPQTINVSVNDKEADRLTDMLEPWVGISYRLV